MNLVRLLALGVVALGGCVVAPPPGPAMVVLPGKGKDQAAFQQDERRCQQAVAQPPGSAPAAGANNPYAAAGVAWPGEELAYAQCMTTLGDTTQALGAAAYPGYPGYPADPGYPAYGYAAYGYPYPDFYGAFYGGWGGGWGGGWRRGGWGHGGWGHGGWGGGTRH